MPIQEHASEQRGTKCANAWRPTLPHPTQEIEAQLRANFLVQPLWKGRRKPSTHADQPLMHEIDGCKFEMLRNFQPSFKQTNNPGFVQVLNLVACSWFEPTTIGWRKLGPSQGKVEMFSNNNVNTILQIPRTSKNHDTIGRLRKHTVNICIYCIPARNYWLPLKWANHH